MEPLLRRCTSDEVVENVEVSFRRDSSNTISLKVIIKGFYTDQFAPIWELKFAVFSKMRGIGIKESWIADAKTWLQATIFWFSTACFASRWEDEVSQGLCYAE